MSTTEAKYILRVVWVPTGTVLTVWNVYGGSIGGFIMRDPVRFVVQRGEVEVLNAAA